MIRLSALRLHVQVPVLIHGWFNVGVAYFGFFKAITRKEYNSKTGGDLQRVSWCSGLVYLVGHSCHRVFQTGSSLAHVDSVLIEEAAKFSEVK